MSPLHKERVLRRILARARLAEERGLPATAAAWREHYAAVAATAPEKLIIARPLDEVLPATRWDLREGLEVGT
jgi:hypothetical protein